MYIWKCEYTDTVGNPKSEYVISETETITSATPLECNDNWTPGTDLLLCAYNPFTYICGATATVEELNRVDYNKPIFEFDTQVTVAAHISPIGSNVLDDYDNIGIYPIVGGTATDLINMYEEGIDLKFIAHNYNGSDEEIEIDNIGKNSDGYYYIHLKVTIEGMGVTCDDSDSIDGAVYKIAGTDKLCLVVSCNKIQ